MLLREIAGIDIIPEATWKESNLEYASFLRHYAVFMFYEPCNVISLGYKPEGRGFDSQWCH